MLDVIADADDARRFASGGGGEAGAKPSVGSRLSLRARRREEEEGLASSASFLARRSEEEALRVLIGEHEAAIGRLAHSMLKDRRDVEEAVLDTFAKAFAARRRYRGEASERTWLHRICFHLCIDRLRRRKADCVPLDPDIEQLGGEPDPDLRLVLWAAIEALPLRMQATFKLRHAGYSVTEIAKLAGEPRTTVSGHYNSARKQLRERLACLLAEPSQPRSDADHASR